jgi:hypothetical protein
MLNPENKPDRVSISDTSRFLESMNRLADEIHALRLELTPSLRKTEALQDKEAERKLRLIHIRKKAAGGK